MVAVPNLPLQCGPYPERDLKAIGLMLAIYCHDIGRFPNSAESLDALVSRPAGASSGWRKLLDEVPRDWWGGAFVYRFPSPEDLERFELLSLGPDGVPSTASQECGTDPRFLLAWRHRDPLSRSLFWGNPSRQCRLACLRHALLIICRVYSPISFGAAPNQAAMRRPKPQTAK
jgi:hypothetical protein